MASIAKELKKIRTTDDAAFSTDRIRRVSLVYDDPARVQTLECYSQCEFFFMEYYSSLGVKHFETLCDLENTFAKFRGTLFSTSSVELQPLSLTEAQRRFIHKEISQFLSLASPHLRSKHALFSIEWLVHKYSIQDANFQDLMRCVMPYVETALFPKFCQLLTLKSLSPQWSWLAEVAKSGEPPKRLSFVKQCRKSKTLLPFISTSILTMAEHCAASPSNLNEYCNLLISIVTSICDESAGSNKKSVVKLVDQLQGLISLGLKKDQPAPLRSAIQVIILKLNNVLDMDERLITTWIRLLLKHSPESAAFTTLNIVLQLMTQQRVCVLSDKLASLRANLVDCLSAHERAAYDDLLNKASIADVDPTEVAAQAVEVSEAVAKVTEAMDVDVSLSFAQEVPAEPKNRTATSEKSETKRMRKRLRKMSSEELLPNCDCSCIKPMEFQRWLSATHDDLDGLRPGLVRESRLLRLLGALGEESANTCVESAPLLVALLLAPESSVRVQAVSLLSRSMPSELASQFQSEELAAQLRNEPLQELQQSCPELVVACLQLLADRSAEEWPECWAAAVQLFSGQTARSLLRRQAGSAIWVPFVGLVSRLRSLPRSLKEAVTGTLHADLFHALASDQQTQLLRALLDNCAPAGHGCLDSLLVEQVDLVPLLHQLQLECDHFVTCLRMLHEGKLKALSCRFEDFSSKNKSVSTPAQIDMSIGYLRGLESLAAVLASSVPQLHRRRVRKACEANASTVAAEVCATGAVAALTKLASKASKPGKSAAVTEQLKERVQAASMALSDLLQPLVQQLLTLNDDQTAFALEMQQGQEEDAEDDDDDEDSGHEEEEDGDQNASCVLPLSFLEQEMSLLNAERREPPPLGYVPATPERLRSRVEMAADRRLKHSLLKNCIHQVVSCLASIFGQANEDRRQALSVAMAQQQQQHPGRGSRAAHRLVQLTNTFVSESAIAKAQQCIEPLFMTISTFPQWPSLLQQVLQCLIEVATMFPRALCERLLPLVQWVTEARQNGDCGLMRLDDSHCLSLIGRLVSVAVPALVEASRDPPGAACHVLMAFVDNFAQLCKTRDGLQDRHARRKLALYCGVVHGLGRACLPLGLCRAVGPKQGTLEASDEPTLQLLQAAAARAERYANRHSLALATWLWIAAAFFLNKDWTDEDVVQAVPEFLVRMFNQFPLSVQVEAWSQCLAYFLFVVRDKSAPAPQQSERRTRLSLAAQEEPVQPTVMTRAALAKRRRTTSYSESKQQQQQQLSGMSSPPLESVRNFSVEDAHQLANLLRSQNAPQEKTVASIKSRKRPAPDAPKTGGADLWPLAGRLSRLMSAVINSPVHVARVEQQLHEQQEATFDLYSGLVQHSLRLMAVAAPSSSVAQGDDARKECLQGLQSCLVRMQQSLRPALFVRMVGQLLNSPEMVLNKRGLDLLAGRLAHLAGRTLTDKVLEEGLLQLQRCVVKKLEQHGSDGSSALVRVILTCLVHLVQLLAEPYPQECMTALEVGLMYGSTWWPKTEEAHGTHFAESRSLLCTLGQESVRRLALWLHPRWAVLGPKMLQLALDHSATALRLHPRPQLAEDGQLQAGSIHAREQHLLAGLELMLAVMEFAVERQRAIHQRAGLLLFEDKSRVEEEDASAGTLLQFHTDALPMFRKRDKPLNARLSGHLLVFVASLMTTDVATACGSRPDRCSVALAQVAQLKRQVRQALFLVPDCLGLLASCYASLKYAAHVPDWSLFLGVERVLVTVTETAQDQGSGLKLGDLKTAHSQRPELFFNMGKLLLSRPITESQEDALVAIMARLDDPAETRPALLSRFFAWMATATDRAASLLHLTNVLRLMGRLSAAIAGNLFVELCRAVDFAPLALELMTLLTSRGKLNSLMKRLTCTGHLVQFAKSLANDDSFDRPMKTHPKESLAVVRALLVALERWLAAENDACEAFSGIAGHGTLEQLPVLFVSLLDLVEDEEEDDEPVVVEADISPVMSRFLQFARGDEALVRPLCQAICQRLLWQAGGSGEREQSVSHWKTRLACVNLLRRLYESLLETDSLGSEAYVSGDLDKREANLTRASFLVNDTLASLQEALQDDRPEVEAAANKLFADLEYAGLLGSRS